MAHTRLQVSIHFRWWFWPVAWLAYPYLLMTGRNSDRFIDWLTRVSVVAKSKTT